MKSILATIGTMAILVSAHAQSVQGNTVQIKCQPTNTVGATISITPQGNGKTLGTYSLVSNGRNQTELRADLSSLRPTSSKLELISGTTVVRSIPGPAIGDCEYLDEVAHSIVLRPEEDWFWYAAAAALYLAECIDYTGGTTTVTTDVDGNTTTTETSGQLSWNCGGGIVVNVDGTNYSNITSVRLTSRVQGSLPNINSLTVAASGGARITSLR